MKKVFITGMLLLVGLLCFSQEKSADFYKTLLKEIKKLPVINSTGRNYMIKELEKELPDINDSLIIVQYNDYINELRNRKFIETKAKSILSLSRMDLKGFKVKEDKFKKATFINPLGSMTTGKDPLEIYIVIDENNYLNKRLRIRYSGKDWVFMDRILLLINDEVYTYFLSEKPDRDVSGGYVYETSDELLSGKLEEIIDKVINSDGSISIRFQGDNYTDEKLSSSNINRLKKSELLHEKLAKN